MSDGSANITSGKPLDLRVFEAMPGTFALFDADAPFFTILAITADYVTAAGLPRSQITGRSVFEVFPGNPDDPTDTGASNLRSSLDLVIRTGKPPETSTQRYDIPGASGKFEDHYWQATNSPVMDEQGRVTCIIHSVAEITDVVKSIKNDESIRLLEQANSILEYSQRQLLRVTETVPVIIWITDQLGYCTYLNKLWYDTTGQSTEQAHGLGWLDAIHPDDKQETGELFVAANNARTPFRATYRLRQHDGAYRWAMDLGYPRFNPEGEYEGIIGTVVDIHDQKLAEEGIRQSADQFRHLLEALPQMTWTNLPDGKVNFYNQQWYTYTGVSEAFNKGRGFREFIHPDDLALTMQKLNDALASSTIFVSENRYRNADGEYRWHLNRAVPIRNEQGEIFLWVGTATDIQELKELGQQKDDFISVASHELRTPLTSLKGSIQLLNKIRDNPVELMKMPQLMGIVDKSLTRLTSLVENLLNLSRLNKGELQLNKTHFRLVDVIDYCCTDIRITGQHQVLFKADPNMMLYADEERIGQVMVNFLSNAVKYSTGSAEIVIDAQQQNRSVRVSVTDKGPGIHPRNLPHIFDQYYRADIPGRQVSGLGLGLYISAEIIKRHGGKIGVDSILHKGSSFWFTIPSGE